jgi:hypothetical protein
VGHLKTPSILPAPFYNSVRIRYQIILSIPREFASLLKPTATVAMGIAASEVQTSLVLSGQSPAFSIQVRLTCKVSTPRDA